MAGLGVNQTGEFFFCKGGLLIIALFYCLSSGTLCLMTYDRYVYISMPLRYFRKMTSMRAKLMIGMVWSISIINILPVLTNKAFTRSKGPFHELDIKNCVLPKIINIPYFFWLEAIFLTFLLVTIVYNFRIMSYARRQLRKIQATMTSQSALAIHEDSFKMTSTKQESTCDTSCKTSRCKNSLLIQRRSIEGRFAKFLRHARQQKYMKTILCVVLVHCMCNLPYFVLVTSEIIYGYFDYRKAKYAYTLYLLNYLNSVLNPLIYTGLNSSLRRSAKRLLCSLCRRT